MYQPRHGVPQEAPDFTGLTKELVDRLRANRCSHCGGSHARACPRIRRLAYHPNGTVAEVEFWPENKWSDEYIVWLEELPEDHEIVVDGEVIGP